MHPSQSNHQSQPNQQTPSNEFHTTCIECLNDVNFLNIFDKTTIINYRETKVEYKFICPFCSMKTNIEFTKEQDKLFTDIIIEMTDALIDDLS